MTPRHVVLSVWHQGSHLIHAKVTWPENLDLPVLPGTDVLVLTDGEAEVEFTLTQRMFFAKRDKSFTLLSLQLGPGSRMTTERAQTLVSESFREVKFLLV